MNIVHTQQMFSSLASEMSSFQTELNAMRASGQPVSYGVNARLNDVAGELDRARMAYLAVFPTSRVTVDRLRDDLISAAARAGCVKFLAKHELALPNDGSWDNALGSAIVDVQRAAAMLARA